MIKTKFQTQKSVFLAEDIDAYEVDHRIGTGWPIFTLFIDL